MMDSFPYRYLVHDGVSTSDAPPRATPCEACQSFEVSPKTISIEAAQLEANAGCPSCAIVVCAFQLSKRDTTKPNAIPATTAEYLAESGPSIRLNNRLVYEIFTTYNAPKGHPIRDKARHWRIPQHNSGSDESVQVILEWIQNCSQYHARRCKQTSNSMLPTRILDLDCPQGIRLCSGNGLPGPYCALSHCWGTAYSARGPPIVTKATLQSMELGIEEASLSKTFRDAVALTRKLSIRYLWIDSLCILQDDVDDWDRESAQMASVFEGAYLVIAATYASHGGIGCFQERSCPWSLCFTHRLPDNTQIPIYVRQDTSEYFHSDAAHLSGFPKLNPQVPLLSRAWCFQERLLATRLVHFTKEELVWECNSRIKCECKAVENFRFSSLKARWASPNRPHVLFKIWHEILQVFMETRITKTSDRLPALSGLAKRMQARGTGQYVAGLWKDNLVRDLLWVSSEGRGRLEAWQAPSWSWACLKRCLLVFSSSFPTELTLTSVDWKNVPRSPEYQAQITFHTTVLDVEYALGGSDPTGRVNEASLTISAPATTVSALYSRIGSDGYLYISKNGERVEVFIDDPSDFENLPNTDSTLLCVWIASLWKLGFDQRIPYLLILRGSEGIGGRAATPGAFERVGAKFPSRHLSFGSREIHAVHEWFEDAEVRTIRMV